MLVANPSDIPATPSAAGEAPRSPALQQVCQPRFEQLAVACRDRARDAMTARWRPSGGGASDAPLRPHPPPPRSRRLSRSFCRSVTRRQFSLDAEPVLAKVRPRLPCSEDLLASSPTTGHTMRIAKTDIPARLMVPGAIARQTGMFGDAGGLKM